MMAGDFNAAIRNANKALALSTQVCGLDSSETLQHHIQLGSLYIENKNFDLAFEHFLSAKYLVHLLGGERHTEASVIYSHLAVIAKESNDLSTAIRCLTDARLFIADLNKYISFSEELAEIHLLAGNAEEALAEQRNCHRLNSSMGGLENPRTIDSKNRMDKYRRYIIEKKVSLAKEQRNQVPSLMKNGFSTVDFDNYASNDNNDGMKKSKSKKSKGKKK